VILAKDTPKRDGDLATIEKRGGSGTAAKLTPDPRTTTHPNRKSGVVE
jgi:hypothetical protein